MGNGPAHPMTTAACSEYQLNGEQTLLEKDGLTSFTPNPEPTRSECMRKDRELSTCPGSGNHNHHRCRRIGDVL